MKKKQLFAVLLAGSMTVGMAPAAAFAAEDTGAVTEAEAPTADENTETPDDGAAVDDQSQSEADAQAAAQAQAEAEAQAAAQAQAEAEAQAAAQAQAEAEAQAAAQAQAEEAQQEQQTTAADATVTTAEELQAAINNAPDFTGSIDDSDLYTSAYKILISASFNLTDTITVPAKKNIAIFGATDATTVVGRGSVAGDMFKVSAGSILSMTQNEGDGSSEIGKLSVEGNKNDGTAADGSIVSVEAGAKFVMTTGVTLSKNVSTAAGAAVKNSGKLVITGGEIKDNVSTGGAVYSTGTISLEQGTNAAADEPKIIENYTSGDKSVKSNIVLGQQDQSAGSIIIAGAFENQNIGYSVENPTVDYTVFQKPESLAADAFEKAVNAMSYEGDQSYGINTATGQLVSNKPTVTIDSATSEEANTVSVTFTSDKAGTYFYKYVAKGAEAPTIEKAIEGGTVKAGETTSLKLTNVTDKTIDLYIWVKESESGNDIVGEGVKKDIAVTQAQNPDNPKPAAPKVTKISAESKTATTAEVVLQSDKSGKCYYKCVAKGADKPSITAKDNYVAITEKKDFKIDLKNLKGDAIDLYVQVVAKDGSKTAVTKIATVTLKKETAKTPAKISNISYKWKSHTSATVTMRSDKAGVYYYKWVKRGSKAPTVDKMSKGKNVSANKDFTISLKDLDANNAIDVYVCIKGTDGTVSTPKKIALDEAMRPANVKWIAFEWTSHTSAVAKFVTTKSGKLYYAWVTRDEAGNSKIPDIYNSGNSIETGADREISIYLNDLDPDNAIDLYVRFKDNNGIETVPLKLNLKEENRPAEGHNPKSYKVSDSRVYGLDDPLEFYPNTFYEFRVVGAGTDNDNPGEQDVKWVPLYWSTSANPSDSQKHSAWKIGSAKGINKDATYNLYVFFQKYVYTGGQWQQTDTIESAVYQFKSAKLTPTGTPGADGSYGGGQTGSDPNATITGEASATSSNGGNGTRSKNAVSTADNSPIGTMSALAVASLLAGGYVIVRRRKKDI
ncbi:MULTISPECIES: hypothetical protein [unclassified Blautia]|uniref:hypothetical protein n=1 Tax=unclassified Blautia TaxID=2648079 RepID=UPI001FD22C6E|nr:MULTISPECIES: hypothetical protein [unclassified Blautia]MCJ7861402.1 hypothetical protein [Blautia sp. NSJ-157]MCJ7864519.1 hypothetical protein [Blautia sp. NSJ-140]